MTPLPSSAMSQAREYTPKQIELAVNTIKTLSIEAVEKACPLDCYLVAA